MHNQSIIINRQFLRETAQQKPARINYYESVCLARGVHRLREMLNETSANRFTAVYYIDSRPVAISRLVARPAQLAKLLMYSYIYSSDYLAIVPRPLTRQSA